MIGVVCWLTLTPASGADVGGGRRLCVLCGDRGTADLLENLLLFAPLGAALRLTGLPLRFVIAISVALASGIEVGQLFIPGRWATLRDLLSNGAGAWAGAACAPAVVQWRSRPQSVPAVNWRLLIPAAAFPTAAVLLGAWLMAPSLTTDDWFGQWTPRFAYVTPYSGELSAVTIGPSQIPHGMLPNSNEIRESLRENRSLTIEGTLGTPPPRLSAIFAITDGAFRTNVFVGAEKTDLMWRVRRRADALHLDAPTLRFEGFFDERVPGERFQLTLTRNRHEVCASLGPRTSCAPEFRPGRLWSLIRPLSGGPAIARSLDALVFLILALPLGIIAAGVTPRAAIVALAVAVLALGCAAPLVGEIALSAPEWLGFVLGIGLGGRLRPRPRILGRA